MHDDSVPSPPHRRRWWLLPVALVVIAAVGAMVLGPVRHHMLREARMRALRPQITRAAHAQGLDPSLVEALVWAESGGRPDAHSGADARGLMQVTPLTQKEVVERLQLVGPGDLFDPDYNLAVGCAYLSVLHERFPGHVAWVLAAYNWGPTHVQRWRHAHVGSPASQLLTDPDVPGETRAYVPKVLARQQKLKSEM